MNCGYAYIMFIETVSIDLDQNWVICKLFFVLSMEDNIYPILLQSIYLNH